MPKKGENIFKRKDGRWEGRYIKARTWEGKAVYGSVYGHTYNDVKKKLCGAISSEANTAPRSCPPLVPSGSFAAVAQEWLRAIRPQVKDSTYVKYRNLLYIDLLPRLGRVPVAALTIDQVAAHCNWLLAAGGAKGTGLSPKTVADTLSLLRCILHYAQTKGMAPACTGREISIKQHPKKLRVLSRTEQRRLCRYLTDHPCGKNLGILLCLFAGLRVGEVCALRWEDVSLEEGMVYVHQTMQRLPTEGNGTHKTAVVITTPKSPCSVRQIPLPDHVLRVIQCDYPQRTGYVLTGSEKFIEPRTMQYHFSRVLEKTRIEHVNFHVLRHTFATRCVEVGFDVKSLSEILGHANVNITLNRYVHPTMELKRENMQRLSRLLAAG